MLLLGPGVLRAFEVAGEIEQIAKLPLRVILNGKKRTIAHVKTHGLVS